MRKEALPGEGNHCCSMCGMLSRCAIVAGDAAEDLGKRLHMADALDMPNCFKKGAIQHDELEEALHWVLSKMPEEVRFSSSKTA